MTRPDPDETITYITHSGELPSGASILIYGAGGRGRRFAKTIKSDRPDLRVTAFLDSFKPGRVGRLPVHVAGDLPALLERQGAGGAGGAAVVVASFSHGAIGRELARRGVKRYYVLLEDAEAIPYLNIPLDEITSRLNASHHPLKAPRKSTLAGQGTYWRCPSLTGLYLRPTGFTLCCWMPDLVRPGEPEAAIGRLADIRRRIVTAIDQGECDFCASCPELVPTQHPGDTGKISLLHMDTSTVCNLSCSYCNVKQTMPRCDYDPEALFDQFRRRGVLASDYSFDWGGFGEPSINPHFGSLTGKMLDDGASGLVYTNALTRHPVIERGLAEGRLVIRCSVDAGTRETYRAVRGVDAFETVWENLKAYAKINSAGVSAKYIVTTGNAALAETDAFVERCLREGIRHVAISKDFFSKRTPAPVREGVRNLALRCREHGLPHDFLITAMSPAFVKSLKLDSATAKRSRPQ